MRGLTLVAAAAGHAVLARLLYAHADTLPPGAGHVADAMRAAAQVMYYGGDVAGLLLAVALFATWYRRRGRLLPAPPRASDQPRGPHSQLTATHPWLP